MILTPEQRVYAIMGLDVFVSNRQGGSWTGPLLASWSFSLRHFTSSRWANVSTFF